MTALDRRRFVGLVVHTRSTIFCATGEKNVNLNIMQIVRCKIVSFKNVFRVFSPHRNTTCTDAAYCYRPGIVVSRSVCLSVAVLSLATRRSCCRRREPPRDAGHLYRKLAHNPRATQWIERTLKPSANIGKLSKKHFISVPLKDWRILPHGITGLRTKVH